jgi:STE24 endopeptidase
VPVTEAIFTPAELAEVHAYHQPLYWKAALDDAVTVGVSLLLLRFAVRPLWAACERVKLRSSVLERMWRGPGWAPALLFAMAWVALTTVIYLPLDVWFGYVHEHRFGLSRQTPASFALDHLKDLGITATAVGALAFGLFGLARRMPRWWAVLGAAGAVALLLSTALDPYRARVYFEQTPLPAGELRERINALMARAGVDFRDVLVEHTSGKSVRVQAYFAGTGPTRTIVLNDSLLQHLTTDEILAVVAHEAGHVGEPRWPQAIGSAAALVLFLFAVDRLLKWVARRGLWGVTEPADLRALPLVMLVFSVATSAVKPLSAAFSRERERQADLYALRLTGAPDAFASMLRKAARVNKMDPDPPRWVVWKGRTHPSVGERLEAIARGDWRR